MLFAKQIRTIIEKNNLIYYNRYDALKFINNLYKDYEISDEIIVYYEPDDCKIIIKTKKKYVVY